MKTKKLRKGALTIAMVMIISVSVVVLYSVAVVTSTQRRVRNAVQTSIDSSLITINKVASGGAALNDGTFTCAFDIKDLKASFKDDCFEPFFTNQALSDYIYCEDKSNIQSFRNFRVDITNQDTSYLLSITVYLPTGFYRDYSNYFSNKSTLANFKSLIKTKEDSFYVSAPFSNGINGIEAIEVTGTGSCKQGD